MIEFTEDHLCTALFTNVTFLKFHVAKLSYECFLQGLLEILGE